jgi:hypothetical protein
MTAVGGVVGVVAVFAALLALGRRAFTDDGLAVQPRACAWADESKRRSWAERFGA